MKDRNLVLVSLAFALGASSAALADCPNLPSAWIDPGGRPVPVELYETAARACKFVADHSLVGQWRLQFVACMRKHRFKPVYHDVFC